MNPTDVAIRSSPVASLMRTRSGERARMTFSVFRPVWLASAARPTASALSTSPGWWPKAPAELGDILLEQRRTQSSLLELGWNGPYLKCATQNPPNRTATVKGLAREIRCGKRHIVCRSEEHTSELQSRGHLVCRLLLEKKIKQRVAEPLLGGHHPHPAAAAAVRRLHQDRRVLAEEGAGLLELRLHVPLQREAGHGGDAA